jgi:hypothetical protein
MKKRKRKEPGPLALDPFKLDLEPFKIDLEPLDLKLGPLPEIDLDKLPEPLADGPAKARKGSNRHRRTP